MTRKLCNIRDKIYIDVSNGKFYIILGHYLYKYNGELINVSDDDINAIKQTKGLYDLSQINIKELSEALNEDYDKYDIVHSHREFFTKGRIIYYKDGDIIGTGVIVNVDYLDKDEINIKVLTEEGNLINYDYTLVSTNLGKLNSVNEIYIDNIIEILNFYNIENKSINIEDFIQ